MSNQDRGPGAGGQAQEFERLARQYWAAWGDALRTASPDAAPLGAHAWQDAIDWWTRYAHGGRHEVNDALERFGAQARDWYAYMQQARPGSPDGSIRPARSLGREGARARAIRSRAAASMQATARLA